MTEKLKRNDKIVCAEIGFSASFLVLGPPSRDPGVALGGHPGKSPARIVSMINGSPHFSLTAIACCCAVIAQAL